MVDTDRNELGANDDVEAVVADDILRGLAWRLPGNGVVPLFSGSKMRTSTRVGRLMAEEDARLFREYPSPVGRDRSDGQDGRGSDDGKAERDRLCVGRSCEAGSLLGGDDGREPR